MAIQSRLTSLTETQMDDAQRAVLREILSGPRGYLDGPSWPGFTVLSWPAMRSDWVRSVAITLGWNCV